MRVYIAGPMSGLPDFNYPAFHAAEARLRDAGHEPVNPARPYDVEPADWKGYMVRALSDVASCEVIGLLPGWAKSRGARLELTVALALDLDVRHLDVA